MTVPRQVLPGTTYLVTRRCARREFLLRPSAVTNAIFLYVLAVASRRYGVHVHAFCVLSNHFHLIVTDVEARLPAFEQYLDSLVARAVNAAHGRWESFWAPPSYSAVSLASPEDVVHKAAYVLANPVAAGLVQRGRDWPGLRSSPDEVGTTLSAPRPGTFFRASGGMPPVAHLELCAPPGFSSPAAFADALSAEVADLESRARRDVAAAGRGFLGVAKVLAQKPWGRPASGEPRRKLAPRVAARDQWRRIEVLSRLVEFVRAYRRARDERRAGSPAAIFPAGTYLLRIEHGVCCAAPG